MYSLPSGYEAVTGETIQASQHNPPLEDIESSMSARLMRSGVAPMTGALKIVDGSVGSPAIKFNTDGTTGLYKTTNGIGVSVGGTKVAEFTSSGVSRMIGELIPWTLLSAPSGWVLPYGQTLSRTTYSDLWTIAQAEIAAGNTFFNNGDGTTTFGIGDARGRVIAGKDDMGGAAAGRLTTALVGSTLGASGGTQTTTLTTNEMPSHTHANVLVDPGHQHIYQNATLATTFASKSAADGLFVIGGSQGLSTINGTNISINNAAAGAGGAHNNTQPTIICNYILYAGA